MTKYKLLLKILRSRFFWQYSVESVAILFTQRKYLNHVIEELLNFKSISDKQRDLWSLGATCNKYAIEHLEKELQYELNGRALSTCHFSIKSVTGISLSVQPWTGNGASYLLYDLNSRWYPKYGRKYDACFRENKIYAVKESEWDSCIPFIQL